MKKQLRPPYVGSGSHGNAPLGVGKSGHATDIAAEPAQYCISGAGRETSGRSRPTVALLSAAETPDDAAGGSEVAAVVQGRDVAPEPSNSCGRPAASLTTACSWSPQL